MEFKKCNRCGSFFTSGNDICYNCNSKDETEINILRSYFNDNDNTVSLEEISNNTGITIKNLGRYMESNEFKDIKKNIDDFNINL